MPIERRHLGTPATVLCALAALLGRPAAAAEPTAKDGRYALDLRAEAWGGAFDGDGVRTDSGSVAVLEVAAHPEYRGDGWSLDVPFRVEHRETFGAHLPRTAGGFDVEPWFALAENVRVGLDAGAVGASCPSWPDLYQRVPATGELTPTDRYSYLAVRGGVALDARGSQQHLRARYRYATYDYKDDPKFDPNAVTGDAGEHLTPADDTRHEVDVSWRYEASTFALAIRLDYTRTNEAALLSRTAGSGSTNDGTTPLQVTALWEPSAELELPQLGESLGLSLAYGYAVQEDTYEGYESFTQHHPRVVARLDLTKRLAAVARWEGWFRTYGPNGASTLDYGARRTARRFTYAGELAYRLWGGLFARAIVEWTDRYTNYPDSVQPPAGTASHIDWDYTNLSAVAGLAYRL